MPSNLTFQIGATKGVGVEVAVGDSDDVDVGLDRLVLWVSAEREEEDPGEVECEDVPVGGEKGGCGRLEVSSDLLLLVSGREEVGCVDGDVAVCKEERGG